jgi:hypothetical protein
VVEMMFFNKATTLIKQLQKGLLMKMNFQVRSHKVIEEIKKETEQRQPANGEDR